MAVRRVVHLEHDVRAGLDQFSLSGLQNLRRLARGVTDQKIAGQRANFRLFIGGDLRRREEDAGRLASEPLRFRLADERDEVMHDLPLGRTHFRRLNPAVFSEARRDDDVLILDDAARRDVEGQRQLEHHVRFADAPAFDPLRRLRQIARIAFRRPAIGPSHDRVDLGRAQTHRVREPAVVRIGKPWRHHFVDDGVPDLGRTSAHVPIGQQRKRAGFTGTMADLAILLDDWRDVL